MKTMKTFSVLMAGLVTCAAQATDYYVSTDGSDANDGLAAETAFATIDKAVITARTAGDVIHVQPGPYETTLGTYDSDQNSKWGPNLCVKLIGEGATRDDVIIKSHGNHRTLRMAAGSWVENVTLEGEPNFKADKGGVIEMSGGVLTNCVVRNGTTTGFGGNLYMTGGIAVDCVISNGCIKSTNTNWDGPKGVNVCLNGAAKLIRCHLSGGDTTVKDDGTLYYERGSVSFNNSSAQVENCLIEGSSCGGVIFQSSGHIYNSTIVDNNCYGLWSWDVAKCIVNCVIYGNIGADGGGKEWAGNSPTRADDVFLNNAISANKGALNGTYDTLRIIDETAFADYANKEYAPSSEGALVDAGGADPRGAEASTLDLAGNPRISGTIDIGCYEYQKQEMTVRIVSGEHSSFWAPSTVTFTHTTENSASPENMVFTYDFGDGTPNETTKTLKMDHVYEKPGIYTVKITAVSECEEESAEVTYEGYVRVASSTIYVKPANAAAAFPYNTPETAYAGLAAAISEAYDGYTIYLGEGVYEQTARTAVNKAVTIIGNNANPETVVLRNTAEASSGSGDRRVMSIENAAAVVSGVTLEGGRTLKGNGGNLTISAGMISNCVIRSGVVTTDSSAEYGMGGGVAISRNGIVTHCVITNNEVRGVSKKWGQGGAVVFPWESTGKLLNCLVAGNRWVTDSEAASGTGSAGITYHDRTDGAVVENCTIVNNTISGLCGDGSAAGVYCVWNNTVRNTVIAGNRQGEMVSNVHLAKDGNEWKDRLNTCVTEDELPSGNKTCWTATLDAMFRGYAAGDYNPKIGGALVNRGATFPDVPACDLAGNPRVFGKAIDIGCYECQRKPGVVIVVR